MIFDTAGKSTSPAIVMLNGSFTDGKSLLPIAEKLADEYYIIIPTYDGHHENGGIFTTREEQVRKIAEHLKEENITRLALIQGISMGAEIALDLAAYLYEEDEIEVNRCFFDGGPFFSFPLPVRLIMQKKFMSFVDGCRYGTEEEIIARFKENSFVKWAAKGDITPFREMILGMASVAKYMSDTSVCNESDACYTFDFPYVPYTEQKKYYFSWSSDEPARESKSAILDNYPDAKFINAGKLGHGGFITKKPDKYAEVMRKLASPRKIKEDKT
ncbi:MAG: alpha/beta hydrolase [Oscillospiraceae bacterium]|nr:alpha/beta hydrolase [Oscillospiraceae bacterium]